MNIELSGIGQQFPSRYEMNEEVYFHPAIESLSVAEANSIGLRAKIVGVAFSESKVTYDLALMTPTMNDGPQYYEALPARSVDSIMVKSLTDVAAQDVTRPAAAAFLSKSELRPLVADYQAVASAVAALKGTLRDDLALASADTFNGAYVAFAAAINARPEQQV